MIERPTVDRYTPTMSRVRVGLSRRDITPEVGIQSNPWGMSQNARSTGVHRALTASAMVIKSSSGTELFLVALDLGWICCYECDVVNFRTRVVRELGIELDDLLVNLSQTHKGPPFCIHEANKEGGELVPGHIENVITTVIDLCKSARNKTEDSDITWAYGSCDLAAVRDLPIGDTDYVGFNPDLEADHTLTVARITDSTGKFLATLSNYGCHPTTLGWDSDLVSPDFVGRAREIVESRTGAQFFYLQGACGNLAPRRQYVGDPEVADKNGEILGYATLATLSNMLPPSTELRFTGVIRSGADLAAWEPVRINPPQIVKRKRIIVRLTRKELLSEEQMRLNWSEWDPKIVDFRVQKQIGMRTGYVDGDHVNHPVWLWQLGNALLIAHAGEAYFEMQQQLRQRHPERVIMFLDMTNGPGYVYIPKRSAYERNAYQSWGTLLAPGAFEEMVEILDKAISEFFEND